MLLYVRGLKFYKKTFLKSKFFNKILGTRNYSVKNEKQVVVDLPVLTKKTEHIWVTRAKLHQNGAAVSNHIIMGLFSAVDLLAAKM